MGLLGARRFLASATQVNPLSALLDSPADPVSPETTPTASASKATSINSPSRMRWRQTRSNGVDRDSRWLWRVAPQWPLPTASEDVAESVRFGPTLEGYRKLAVTDQPGLHPISRATNVPPGPKTSALAVAGRLHCYD